MKNFKQSPNNLIQMLNQSVWLNEHLQIDKVKFFIINASYTKEFYIKDILDENGIFFNYTKMMSKFNLNTI